MAWTWAKYVDRGTTGATTNPSMFAFGSLFWAFVAGFHLRLLRHGGTWADYGVIVLCLVIALLWSYFLTRAISRLRNDGIPTR
jgi:uncharacterized YccA/Bax inhibitor family protein